MKVLYACLLSLLLLNLACNDDDDDQQGPIFLGAVYNLTGGQSALDLPSSRGAMLALREINNAGGVDGREVEILLRDGQTDTSALRMGVRQILAEEPATVAFLGLSDTDQVLAAASEAAGSQRAFLTSGATSPLLPDQIPNYLFLACFGDNVQAAAAAEWAYMELDARTASVLYDSTETYTLLLQGYFITRFQELGGQILAHQGYAHGNPGPSVQAVVPSDVIFFAALPDDAPGGVEMIRQAGIATPVVGGDGFDEPLNWEAHTDIESVYFTTHAYLGPDNPDPLVQSFRTAYLGAHAEEPGAFAALGYDAVYLLVQALRNADNVSPESLIQGLEEVQNFSAVTGTISYGPGIRIPTKSVTIMEVVNGMQQFLQEIVPDKVPDP